MIMDIKTILLVEDSLQDVELTIEALGKYNLANNVIVVNDGIEALEYLRLEGKFKNRNPGSPVVVMMDIKMPRMDGIETLKNIRNDENLKTQPVVMLTSSREEQDLIRSYELGVNAYVVKPVAFKEFIEAVKQLGGFWALVNEPPSKIHFQK